MVCPALTATNQSKKGTPTNLFLFLPFLPSFSSFLNSFVFFLLFVCCFSLAATPSPRDFSFLKNTATKRKRKKICLLFPPSQASKPGFPHSRVFPFPPTPHCPHTQPTVSSLPARTQAHTQRRANATQPLLCSLPLPFISFLLVPLFSLPSLLLLVGPCRRCSSECSVLLYSPNQQPTTKLSQEGGGQSSTLHNRQPKKKKKKKKKSKPSQPSGRQLPLNQVGARVEGGVKEAMWAAPCYEGAALAPLFHTQTHTHTHRHADTHTHRHADTQTCRHTHTETLTHTHTDM